MASDALVVVDEWVSEHFFTSDDKSGTFRDVVEAAAKSWAAEAEGLTAGDERQQLSPSPLDRFKALRREFIDAAIAAHSDPENPELAKATADLARTMLAFTDREGRATSLVIDVPGVQDKELKALRLIGTTASKERPLAIIDARAADSYEEVLSKTEGKLLATVTLDPESPDEASFQTPSALLSHVAIAEDGPKYMLVFAGRWAILTSADLWPQGRCLAVDLQTVAERNDLKRGNEVERALTALAATSTAPQPDGTILWDEIREKSVANAVGVSKDLREGVRLSIEIIANEVVRRRDAQGLEPLPAKEAQPLALQSLRYLYRLLFLLHAESSPELGIVPVGAPEYQSGYSVGRLREMTLMDVPGTAKGGTYLYESIQKLCDLVNNGHYPPNHAPSADAHHTAEEESAEWDSTTGGVLTFEELEADLFDPHRTSHINETKLGNEALQKVLQHLLLSKEKKGKERGFISYAALGINQLGAVYESLMSYEGSFATEELVEVAKDGDPHKGSWVVPVASLDESLYGHRVMTENEFGQKSPRTYKHGEFVFRLSGRARQTSASYYSPEVLTKFTVSQGLEELLDPILPRDMIVPESMRTRADTTFQGEKVTRRVHSAHEILRMSVCEPALGSGAFAIEAVRQLAEQYLKRRQDERGEQIEPENYATELQKVKAYIALHNVYGVDLNATAVELAEVSLWLDAMTPGLKAPWFGLRLRAGNSLIGARRATYGSDRLALKGVAPEENEGKVALRDLVATTPAPVSVALVVGEEKSADGVWSHLSSRIFQFLLPGEGWGAAGASAAVKKYEPERAKALREWSKRVKARLTKGQVKELVSLTQRIETLFALAHRRLDEAEKQARRDIGVWGIDHELLGAEPGGDVKRAQIEAWLADENSAYQRLKLVMDAWCALWFWPVAKGTPAPPSFQEWIDTVRKIVGKDFPGRKLLYKERKDTDVSNYLGNAGTEWDNLDYVEGFFGADGAASLPELLNETPWLATAREIAAEQRFFHWELDFAPVFARGGFDFQVGNPPWVRPDFDEAGVLSDFDPWWGLSTKTAEADKKKHREIAFANPGAHKAFVSSAGDTYVLGTFISERATYPEIAGSRPDLYRAFMSRTWAHSSAVGTTALLHPPTHLTDAQAGTLRAATYRHLRRHWRFINEFNLFEEVHHLVQYAVNVYGAVREPRFITASGLYHPSTVVGSLRHDGTGPEPGYKDAEGRWSLTPHRARIISVDAKVLGGWHRIMEGGSPGVPVAQTRMLSTVNQASAHALDRLAVFKRIGTLNPLSSSGWNESNGRRDGYFVSEWGPARSWKETILQGPFFHIGNPFNASRRIEMRNNTDYYPVDLERLAPDALPITEYKPAYTMIEDAPEGASAEEIAKVKAEKQGAELRYNYDYGSWVVSYDANGKAQETTPVRDHFRVMWRAMAASTGERTLIPAIFPPGTGHIHGVFCIGFPDAAGVTRHREVALAEASMLSLLSDFMVRSTAGSNIFTEIVERLPRIPDDHPLASAALLRILRLNCLTDAYAPLWEAITETDLEAFRSDSFTGGEARVGAAPKGRDGSSGPRPDLGDVTAEWNSNIPLRVDEDRRRALLEIDAIMAHVTGVSIDDLVTIYRTQFGVLNGYDRGEGQRAYIFDANGRQITSAVRQTWNKADRTQDPHALPEADRTIRWPMPDGTEGHAVTYELPFRILDREADLREAYWAFAERFGLHTPTPKPAEAPIEGSRK